MTRDELQDQIERSLIHVGNYPGKNTRIETATRLMKNIDEYVKYIIGEIEQGGYESVAERNELKAEQQKRAHL